jgi:PAS domain S-box-containing protein
LDNLEKYTETDLTFRNIVENSRIAIMLLEKSGRIVFLNKEVEVLFGYSEEELLGKMVEVLIPKRFLLEYPEVRKWFFSRDHEKAIGTDREFFALKKDKKEFPVEIGFNPIQTEQGPLMAIYVLDITERKRAKERFRLVVEATPNAMVLVTQEGVISLVNKSAEKLFGYKKTELMGDKIEKLIPKRFHAIHPGHRADFFAEPKTRPMGKNRNLFAMRKDGSEVPIKVGLNPIETTDGDMVLASIVDITERLKQEKIIQNQISELEHKNKELEQFAFVASHDLVEPLRVISNFVRRISIRIYISSLFLKLLNACRNLLKICLSLPEWERTSPSSISIATKWLSM